MNYGEKICEATSIIAENIVKSSKFDRTIKAIVKENKDLQNVNSEIHGEYLCTYEGLDFIAYGTPFRYEKGDNVYILIPSGDYNNKLTIIEGNPINKKDNKYINISIIGERDKEEVKLRLYDNEGKYIGYLSGGTSYDDFESKMW